VVDESGENVLLTHHRFLDRWLQLGGHVDEGETVIQAALRDAREESGLQAVELLSDDIFDVDVHPIPARRDEPAHFHYDIRFAFRAHSAEPIIVSDESHDVAWIPIADLAEYNDSDSVLRMARRWMAKLL
jgi:8-oxo-dGTP pyrophosphatase MutT (NUDIX family)